LKRIPRTAWLPSQGDRKTARRTIISDRAAERKAWSSIKAGIKYWRNNLLLAVPLIRRERRRGMGHLTATAGSGRVARHRRSLCASTALVTLFCAGLGFGPARAQSVTGTGNVSGSSTSLPPPPLPSWSIPTEALYVGLTSPGTLTVDAGGSVSNKSAIIGNVSTGTVTVTGTGSTWTNSSVLNVGYGAVPTTPGTGTLTIEDGGKVTTGLPGSSNTGTTVSAIIGTFYAGVGSVTVSGTDAGGNASTWANAGELMVGRYGSGTLTVDGGGYVSNSNGYIGVFADGTGTGNGTVTVSGTDGNGHASTWANTGDLYVSVEGTGALKVEGGGVVSNADGVIGYDNVGTATVSGTDGSGHASTWKNSGDLYVGYNGAGTLTVENGGKVENGDGYIGFYSNGSVAGSATVSGVGSAWTNTGDLTVGVYGIGNLTVANGGIVSNANAAIGYFNTANGTATVSGAGSVWSNTGGVYVGYDGTGVLTIADGGKVSASVIDLAENAGSSGTINIGAAAGAAAAAAGTLDAASINFVNGTGTLNFNHTNAITLATALASIGSGTHALNHYAGVTTLTGDSSAFKGVTTVEGGTLKIAQGGKLGGSSGVIGSASGTNGFATVTGAGSTWTPGELIVGEYGTGTLTIEDGGKVVSNGGDSIIAYHDTSNGHVTVSGVGSTWNTDRLRVGMAGQGTLLIEAGGYVSSSNAVVGFGNPGGSAMVTGTGSVWNVSGDINLGLFGTGTLTVADGGKVIARYVKLTQEAFAVGTVNIGAAPGSPAAAPGTLEAEKLWFSDGTGTLNFNHTGVITFTPVIATLGNGTSTLNHYAGTTTLTGDSSNFWGTTRVSGGTLLVGDASGNGKLGGVINVDAGGTLGGTGDLGTAGRAVTIAAGGIHAPGSAQTVLGNYVNQGTLQIEGNPAGANKVVVAGAVDITGAALDLVLSPASAASWNVFNGPFTIIDKQSAGAVTGTFGAIMQNLLFLDTRVAYDGGDGNDVTLTLERNDVSFASIGQTRNQRATGIAIDGLGNANPIWRAIALNSDPASVRASLDALSGEIHASTKSALIEDSRFVRNAINDRIRAAFASPGASHAPALAYASDDTTIAVSPDHAGRVFWSYGFGSWGSTDSDGNAAALKRSTGGFLAGTDGPVGDWRVGLVTGYSHSRFNVSDRFSSGDSDNYHFGAYGGTQWGNLSFRSGLAYTWHELDTRRAVVIPGYSDSLRTRYNAGTTQAFGEFGYGMAAAGIRFEPFANLAYVNLRTGDFVERGGVAALTARSETTGVTFTTSGLRAETSLTFWNTATTLRGMLGWRHAFGDTIPTATQAFAGSNVFTIAGVPIARDSAVLEAGLDLNLSPNATLGLAYTGQLASGAEDHGFKANLTVRF
jgi:outer membrane autotransporter protein